MSRRRLPVLLSVLALAPVLSACGEEKVTRAESEGEYFHVAGVKYQVQLSRLLNEKDSEDRGYLDGVALGEQQLGDGEVWFGVFLRAQSESEQPVRTAEDFEIVDTTGKRFRPVALDSTQAWKPSVLNRRNDKQPNGVELSSYSPTGGQVLLFKLPNSSLDNRPLELKVEQGGAEGSVNLDV